MVVMLSQPPSYFIATTNLITLIVMPSTATESVDDVGLAVTEESIHKKIKKNRKYFVCTK